MAAKKFIGDSKVKLTTKTGTISNGVVSQNGTTKGYPSSTSGSTTKKSSGTGGVNLTDQGYPSSTDGYYGGSVSTTKVNTGSSSGSNKSSGGSSGGYSSSSYSSSSNDNYVDPYSDDDNGGGDDSQDRTNANYAALIAAYQQRANEDYLRQQREAAQQAYDRGMNQLNSAYNNQLSSLLSNLNSTKDQLRSSYNQSRKSINTDAENALRQAYINRMLSEKNLSQQMSAMGLNGGATETTLAGMLNNYGNARNNINTTANTNLSNLEGKYNDSLAQAQQAYNSAVANANLQKAQYAMNLEDALANNQIGALNNYQNYLQQNDDRYLSLLQSAVQAGADISNLPLTVSNSVTPVEYNQESNNDRARRYAAIQSLMNNGGMNANNIQSLAAANPAAGNYLAAILSQLRG